MRAGWIIIIPITTKENDKMNITVKIDIDNEALKASGMSKDQLWNELHRNAKVTLLMTAHRKGVLTKGSLQETTAKLHMRAY